MENRRSRVRGTILSASCVLLAAAQLAQAETLLVRVFDRDRNPVPDVAVFVEQQGAPRNDWSPAPAVMDQRDKRFVPHVLIVQRGAEVEFPNSDVIAHHVYSFSKPNSFELPLYKGTPPDPVRFEHEGIVTLGCNIHDSMLGYIVVVGTDVFGMTDERGSLELELDSGATSWNVRAWSPRFREPEPVLEAEVRRGDALTTTFVLRSRLGPAHDEDGDSVSWTDYD